MIKNIINICKISIHKIVPFLYVKNNLKEKLYNVSVIQYMLKMKTHRNKYYQEIKYLYILDYKKERQSVFMD